VFARALLLLLLAASLPGQEPPLPSGDQLAAITRRGRTLAAYDFVAWHGSDAIMELRPDSSRVGMYIARGEPTGWVLAIGRLSATLDTFYVAYEARVDDSAKAFRARALEPRVADTDYYARAARALVTTLDVFKGERRPYNLAVFPVEGGDGWWVYHFPAQLIPGVWPHGGDWRYRVSSDGRTILETRQLHRSILESQAPDSLRGKIERGYHTAIMDDMVEDTDVFLVLARKPVIPETVVSRSFMFTIDTTGAITCVYRHAEPSRRP